MRLQLASSSNEITFVVKAQSAAAAAAVTSVVRSVLRWYAVREAKPPHLPNAVAAVCARALSAWTCPHSCTDCKARCWRMTCSSATSSSHRCVRAGLSQLTEQKNAKMTRVCHACRCTGHYACHCACGCADHCLTHRARHRVSLCVLEHVTAGHPISP